MRPGFSNGFLNLATQAEKLTPLKSVKGVETRRSFDGHRQACVSEARNEATTKSPLPQRTQRIQSLAEPQPNICRRSSKVGVRVDTIENRVTTTPTRTKTRAGWGPRASGHRGIGASGHRRNKTTRRRRARAKTGRVKAKKIFAAGKELRE